MQEKANTINGLLFDYLSGFIEFTEEEWQIISTLISLKHCHKDEILLEEGKKSKDSYLVIKGCLRSYYMVDGEEKTTEFFTEQDIIAPVCVTDATPSKYFISCIEDSTLLVSNPALEEIGFSKFPKLEILCRVMSEIQSARKQSDLDYFKISSPEERYLNLMQTRSYLFQRVPQYQLASYLGITPPSLSRLRKRITVK